MKKLPALFLFAIWSLNLHAQQTGTASATKMAWWKEARFGLFVHWGLYAVAGGEWKGNPAKGGEHLMLYQKIPLTEYALMAKDFNPVKFDADSWVKAAKDVGMKYIVFTTKHHEGFAMYNSPASNYNIVLATPYAKDPMKMLASSCRKYGMKLCFYYSLGRDWADPDVPTNWPTKGGRSNTWDYPNEDDKDFSKYFERKVKPQIKELLSQYGPVGVLWFDTPELISAAQSKELRELILSIQPGCIINERIGNGFGDYSVSEQKLGNEEKATSKPWESCITMSKQWGYNKYDTLYKSPEVLIRNLIEVASANGNFLLNVGPTGEGEITGNALSRLAEVGKWMKVNGQAIYGTHAWKVQGEYMITEEQPKLSTPNTMKDVLNDVTSQNTPPDIRFTSKGNKVYAFVRSWKQQHVLIHSLSKGMVEIKSLKLLGYTPEIKWVQDTKGLHIEIPGSYKPDVLVYTFCITTKL